MMDKLWLVLFVALAGFYLSYGLPVRSSPETYPHSSSEPSDGWSFKSGWYPAIPALALVVTAVGFLLGCTWCFRHKDCKLFAPSAPILRANQQHQVAESHPEPSNNNISEDNNNGPISLLEMQNIANNNAAAYIVSENEERNRVNRDSVVEFVPLPIGLGAVDPLERCADWFAGESFPRSRLQYLREIARGWFGRVVEGEIEDEGGTSSVAVKILNQTASLEDKARFLEEARMFRDVTHENILPYIAKCLDEDPWILMFELCPVDLQQYLVTNRPKMAIMNDSGVPLRLMSDVTAALAYLHARGHLYRNVSTSNILVRGEGTSARALLGSYVTTEPSHELTAPESRRRPSVYTTSSEIWTVGNLIWEICAWGSAPLHHPPRLPDLPCPYRNHLYQIMQLCWSAQPENRPTSAQVQDLINHLYTTHLHSSDSGLDNDDFEDRWQRLKPNTIPKVDEHVAIVHAPSISNTSNFTTSTQELDNTTNTQDTLSLDLDTAVSRSSSIMSDKDPMSGQIKSESLTNLHGSLEDVRNIYLTHNETAALECHQGNISLEDREKELDKSDSSMDPWLKEIIAGSHDDVSYYKDVSDVIKNLDNILNSEKTSSSESSHQASPSRDNLSLDCKKEYTMQSSLVKSPGITNFQSILDGDFDSKDDQCDDEDADNETVGTLSHSFERYSDTTSQHTLANLTPETPNKELKIAKEIEFASMSTKDLKNDIIVDNNYELPNEIAETAKSELPKLKQLCQISLNRVSVLNSEKHTNKDCDNIIQENGTTDMKENESKSVGDKETSIEQLLSEVNLVENQPINSKLSEVKFSSLVLRNDEQNCDNRTINPVMPHRTIMHDITPTELLIQAERNMVASDFCLPEKKHTEFESNLSTLPIESQNFPEEIAVNDTNNSDPSDIKSSTNLCCSLETQYITSETPIHKSISVVNKLADSTSQFESVGTIVTEELTLPQDIFREIDTTLLEEKKAGMMDQKDTDLELSKKAIEQDTHTYLENTNQINSAKCEFDANSQMASELEPSFVSQAAVTNNHTMAQASDTFQEKSAKPSTVSVDAPTLINLARSKSTSAENFVALENFKDTKIDHDLAENAQDNLNNVLLTNAIENEQHIAEFEGEDLHKILKSDLVSQEDNVDQTEPIPHNKDITETDTSPKIVQNIVEREYVEIEKNELVNINGSNKTRSDSDKEDNLLKQTNEDTVYMDLINDTSSEILHDDNLDKDVTRPCSDSKTIQRSFSLINDDSTMYLDLPSRIKETHDFLQSERTLSVRNEKFENKTVLSSSTPEGTSMKVEDSPNAMEDIDEARIFKLEQKYVDSSPPESPTKSHHTDTYDENSSVVLGPFESNSVGSYHQHRPQGDLVDLPKEELLAFSSNFSEMNLETPSPLRDVNFLKEVPDILPDDLQFDDLETISEAKKELSEPLPLPDSNSSQDETDSQAANVKVAAPLTPPNSPGVFLVSDQQPKYLVDIDLNPPNPPVEEINRFMQNEIELNQIELQITSKLAMAENENNMNIEYSGPLVEEGMEQDSLLVYEDEAGPERILAGNLEEPEPSRPSLSLDEECVQALRNELELKLPLAQVASIEPQADGEWNSELPPPPELIVNYPGALSPIQEETRQQLSAYENDAQWNPTTLPDSSESYPEPCNNSTDDVTDISMGNSGVNESTFVVHSESGSTYTVDKDPSSKKITMSTDSLNGSSLEIKPKESLSPIDDKTLTKNNEDTACERLSQVSPFLLSPSTDTTIPENSENATASSTFVKTFVPSDSKFINTQCLSTATSIDSCCSNDTLYNVEENFDDLAMDPELLPDFEQKDDEFRERRHSYCSTYTVRDDKSDPCDTFSPDSISENNYTYTNMAKNEIPTVTPSVDTKSDKSDKKSNDLAYGTLPSYSNCATEYLSGMEEAWKVTPLEMIRKSPIHDEVSTPPRIMAAIEDIPQENFEIKFEPSIKKMDSVEITCLDDSTFTFDKSEKNEANPVPVELPDTLEQQSGVCQCIESVSEICFAITSPDNSDKILLQASEEKIEDVSSIANVAFLGMSLLEEHEKKNSSEAESLANSTLTYSDFERSASNKPQHKTNSIDNQSGESGISSEDFLKSIRERPQDLSSGISASSLLLANERIIALSLSGIDSIPLSQTDSLRTESTLPLISQSPSNRTSEQQSGVPFFTSTPSTEAGKVDQTCIESVSENCFAVTSPDNSDKILMEESEENIEDVSSIANVAFLGMSLLEEHEKKPSPEAESLVNSTLTYSNFERSASNKPQHKTNSIDNQSGESGISSEDFLKSIRERPQDLSSGISASSLLLANERIIALSLSGIDSIPLSQTDSLRTESTTPLVSLSPSNPNLNDAQTHTKHQPNNLFVTDLDNKEETDQPHSIIITDLANFSNESNRTYDSHINKKLSDTFNSHDNTKRLSYGDYSEETLSNDTSNLKTDLTHVNTEFPKNLIPNGSAQAPLVSLSPSNPNSNDAQTDTKHQPNNLFVTDLDDEEETDQPHSIIITDLANFPNESLNRTYDLQVDEKLSDTFNSRNDTSDLKTDLTHVNTELPKNLIPNGSAQADPQPENITEANCNSSPQVYATVNFLSDAFEELLESNVDGNDSKSIDETQMQQKTEEMSITNEIVDISSNKRLADKENLLTTEINGVVTGNGPAENHLHTNGVPEKVVTENFLRSEKFFCQSDSYLPLLSDIRFTGPGSEIMSTSFNQDSPTEPESPESEKDKKCDAAADILKEWDSDSDNHSSNSSSGEFIWKDGDGNETAVVPSTQFQHQRSGAAAPSAPGSGGAAPSSGSGDSGSGSEGDEVEFVPSSWDCSAAPSKSSMRSLEQITPSKKRVVFKRQKYHCVYEYPREVCELESDSPAAFMPDLSTYCEWDPATAEDAEIGYSELFGSPNPLDMFTLRSGIAYGAADYDEDFFISSSARPFESLGVMSTSSQFFPGKQLKPSLERGLPDRFPSALSPLTTLAQTATPSLDFTTPDSGVEDITPGSMVSEEEFKKKLPEDIQSWRPADSGSSSESVSPSSPAGEALGGLRHTRDRLKLDLPPSPHVPSPRHNRVFNFVLDKPKRHRYSEETPTLPEVGTTPLVMTDETPIITALPIPKTAEDVEVPEPTFSTFGKCSEKNEDAEQKCIVLDEVPKTTPESESKEESENHGKVETVKGEGTVLDSGDEDSGIESSKATLERNKTPNVSS